MPDRSPANVSFEAIRESLLREVAEQGRIATFPRNATLIREGERGDTLFVILSGKVKVFSCNREGKEVMLDIHGPGETIGEMALDEGVRSASVIAIEPTTCSLISRDMMRRYITANPDFALQLIGRLIRRTRIAVENVKRLALLDVYGRVTALITSLTPDGVAGPGTGTLTERLSQQEIAERVGASRDMVSRILQDLAANGYIAIRSRRIDVLNRIPPA
ncbi:MAG: Crp/Fnr family transcriptional regulator [Betaproteobacteria bacterium]